MLGRLVHKALSARGRRRPYEPDAYWEARATELVEVYDHPETWADRGWMSGGVEDETVPRLVVAAGGETVLVPGAGSGRQYGYLLAHGLQPSGFDISPSLVATCNERFPMVPTHVGSVIDAGDHATPADAVVTSGVLQHVRTDDIGQAVRSLQRLARRLIVARELTELATPSPYQFVHDYDALFAGWREVHREITDRRDGVTVELIAWTRP